MTGKQRMYAAIKGEEVDRPPIWLREGFNIGGNIKEEPMQDVHGSADEHDADFYLGWKNEPLYRELFEYVEDAADTMVSWDLDGYLNRFLVIPPKYIHDKETRIDDDTIIVDGWVDTPRGKLTWQDKLSRGLNTYWHLDHLVTTPEELKMIAEIPFEFDPSVVPQYIEGYEKKLAEVGDRGILRLEYPSPIVAISANMALEDFLAMSATEKELFHRLLEEITERLLTITDAVFKGRNLETIVNFGGSEQCTPPMMAPEAFDEYVVPYDGKIIERLKSYGIPVNMHAHGKVRHALSCMKQMGVDSTDPVEPPDAGDVTYAEAREIAGDELTLVGNLEFDELEYTTPDHIRARIKEIAEHGPRRLILGASAGPISKVTPQLAENYKAWIDAALEYF